MRPDERRKAWKTGGVFVGIRRELFQTDKLAAVEGQYWTGSWGLLGANRWGWAKKKMGDRSADSRRSDRPSHTVTTA